MGTLTNITMLVHNRPRLTEQALVSLYANTNWDSFNLTVIDDDSDELGCGGWDLLMKQENATILRLEKSKHVTGMARNLSVYWAEKYWGRGDYLYLSDNDVYFEKGWLESLVTAYEWVKQHRVKLLGPYRHPYHLPNRVLKGVGHDVALVDAVIGLGHFMEWHTWDVVGPLEANAPGTNQSEDFAFCQRIIKSGHFVGCLEPAVVKNCGLVDSAGRPAIGIETLVRHSGLVMEG